MQIYKTKKQVMDSAASGWVRMGFHVVQNDDCADSDEESPVVVVEALIVSVALETTGCTVCRPMERIATNFSRLGIPMTDKITATSS